MPIYNINVRTQSHVADTLRVTRDDLRALRLEMARFAGELLVMHADELWEDQEWQVDVSDEAGLILYVLQISVADTSATMGTLKKRGPGL